MRPTIHRAIRPAIVALACVSLASCSQKSKQDAAPVVTVDVAPVLLSRIQRTIRAEGLIYPRQQAAIVPKISAPIRKAHVQRGARVRAGQLLLELENQDLAGAAAESRATYDQAQATFETAARATVPQEVQKAELDVHAAKDALDAQQAIYDSRQRLLREGAVAEKDVNDTRATLSQARSQSEAAELKVGDEANLIGAGGAPTAAKLTHISPALDTANTTVEVWVQADSRDGVLRPGTSLRVEMIARTVPNAL